ncbi:DUF2520 domain-containing protein [Microbacterium algeriense]|uniref:DUF2520 domain-containing protein n=1 Tax=Microbacterium algeriense TaxID=2615184 RepID=A0ABQ6V3K0_9MICO|nr:DUF2520 domain-containing protein [Microbacterium algeriense]KAB1862753.1 DUF2520 domain-containing protein [Microbacterium algeriense]
MQTALLAPTATLAVLGGGRLGVVLARALSDAGFAVHGPFGRGARIPEVDVALLCVPDAEIPEAASAARPHVRLVGHVSGATQLGDADFSLHPLQTFTGAESSDAFHGIGAAIAGRTPDALAVAEQLALALGARPFAVDEAHRASYHAAASFASNFVLTLLDAAEELASSAGLRAGDARRILAPLVHRTVDNWVATGARAALTGPIARGDARTVTRQGAAIDEDAPTLRPLFDELVTATRSLAAAPAEPARAADAEEGAA